MPNQRFSPILPSLPLSRLLILLLWRNNTSRAIRSVAQIQERWGIKNSAARGAAIVAVNAAREDTLKPNAITSQINAQTKAVAGESAKSTPNAVATPLPPLNPKNTGHICPTSAASATAAIALSDKPSGS